MSENMRMHSLNPMERRSVRSWRRMATPTHSGKEQLPSNKVSQRW